MIRKSNQRMARITSGGVENEGHFSSLKRGEIAMIQKPVSSNCVSHPNACKLNEIFSTCVELYSGERGEQLQHVRTYQRNTTSLPHWQYFKYSTDRQNMRWDEMRWDETNTRQVRRRGGSSRLLIHECHSEIKVNTDDLVDYGGCSHLPLIQHPKKKVNANIAGSKKDKWHRQ